MKQLKCDTKIGVIVVLIAGTLSHFLYKWTEKNFIIGFFTPVNESTWEHMKLLFFPMLLYSIFTIPKWKNRYPCITSSLLSGILLGTLLIPVIFYTYTGILGYHIFILDFLTFVFSVIIAFYTSYKLTLSCKAKKTAFIPGIFICITTICFILFTYYPPDIGLFSEF